MPRSIFVLLLFTLQTVVAQKEASIWYFGHNAGLDFNAGGPVILTNGQIYTDEGVASICDGNGQLLFYTEGTKVWNRQHRIMPNGNGLLGSFSSSQSAVIVPKINDAGKFYIFTIAQLGGSDGFNYSVANMSLDGGNGDIEAKNIRLQNNVCEKLTAVKHCNGRDIWVIVHGFNAATFHAYLVTAGGVSTAPVVSTAGRFVPNTRNDYAIGCMKVSPDGKKIAIAHKLLGVDLLDFDNITGIVSNGNSLFLPTETYGSYRGPYGVEFSPNSKYLYVCGDHFDFTLIKEMSYLLQYNVSMPLHASVQASKKVLYQQQSHWSAENFGTLQMAPDGKMYMAEYGQPFISVINYPDLDGAACQFVHAAIDTWRINVGGGMSRYGLPAFIQSYFKKTFTFRGACTGRLLSFDYEKSAAELSVKWDFGDPASGVDNNSTQESAQHHFSAEGLYTVKLIRFTACGSDTIEKTVSAGLAQVALGNDTIFCGLNQHLLTPDVQGSNNSFLWHDGSTAASFTANKTGLYWVEMTNAINGCSKRDSINLTFKPNPTFDLGNDLSKCDGDIVDIGVNLPATYLWNDGSTNNTLRVSQTGIYWLDVTVGGCTVRDSITISYSSYPSVHLGNDTTLCEGVTLVLDAQNNGMQFQWQDNSSTQTYQVEKAGLYWVAANNKGCIDRDTIKVNYLDKPRFTLGPDTSICRDTKMILSPRIETGADLAYAWSTGSANAAIEVEREGLYSLSLTNGCGYAIDGIFIKEEICNLYIPSAFTPNRDGINETFRGLFGGKMESFELVVYNRWGQIVFRSKDINKGWDGNFQGQPQPEGFYAWIIRYKPQYEPGEKVLKGTVMLVR